MPAEETFEFQTEARQLLDLMIHSVYSNKDIFLRELISNASDALDKLRIEALKSEEIAMPEEPHIRIEPDPGQHTLSVIDNGIGMNREELIRNIGTIARSGTREYLEMLRAGKGESAVSEELIGQFGVGFYSTFMVADRVTVLTRRVGEESGWLWESTGDGTYSLQEDRRPTHGTTVTLHLKPHDQEDALDDYTQEWVIRRIVKHYSDFVTYPILMRVERQEPAHDADGNVVEGSSETVTVDETLNSMKAIWRRPKSDVTQEEYNEFYKHISHDWTDPLETIYLRAEGTMEYYALLFIPQKAPFDLFMQEGQRGLHLYVKRVFIMDDAEEIVPMYLRFVRGVVDSEDLSLNISREILQQNRQITLMRKRITGKVLDTLGEMKAGEDDRYVRFWTEFGRVLKEGILQDHDNRQTLLDLMLVHSTASDELTTLSDYVGRMQQGQEHIYYITGEDRAVMASSPHLEAFRARGIEVLLLSDPVDAVWTSSVDAFEEHQLRSVARGAVDIGTEEEKKEFEEKRRDRLTTYGPILAALQERLADHVKEVRLTDRLRESASCLVADEGAMTPQMEQLMRAMGQDVPQSRRIMELNPDHPVLARLHEAYEADHATPLLDTYAELLFGQALLAEGSPLPDPARFSRLVGELMVK